MDSPNMNWPKWILISAKKHFKAMADDNSITFHTVDDFVNTNDETEFIDFKLTGPLTTRIHGNTFKLQVVIGIYYSIKTNVNAYADTDLVGLILESFTDICVLDNYSSVIGTMRIVDGEIKVNNIGIVDKQTSLKQGFVEAMYEIHLDN